MTASDTALVAEMFGGTLPPELATAYAELLERGLVPEADAASIPHLQPMLDLGLAYKAVQTSTSPQGYEAVSLSLALQAALAHHQDVLTKGFDALIKGARRLADCQAADGDPRNWPKQTVQLITDPDETTRTSRTLVNSTQQDWMTMETGHFEMPPTDECMASCPASYRDRIRIRGIYDRDFAATEIGQRLIASSVADGEHARILAGVPLKLKIADTRVALVPLSLTGKPRSLLIYFPPIVKMLREYYEWLWQRGTPYGSELRPPRDCPLNEGELIVLQWLARDLEDAAIAGKTGMSLSTVRRHVNAIKKGLDVNGRFAAGVAAQRRGWLK
jgi:DNA-binding CsgD family transcriptional regulator